MRNSLILASLFLSSFLIAQKSFKVSIDLTSVTDDKVPVEIFTAPVSEEKVEYHMPKIVPGTYSISDFGRFIKGFEAFDSLGNVLPSKKISTNKWEIENASRLYRITYWVEDSYDDFSEYGDNILFEPGGTSIEADRDVFVINTFGFIGYLDGYKFNPYQLQIKHSEAIEGATSLLKVSQTDTTDTYTAENYNFLADAPLLYCEPDIVTKEIAGANIVVSVYSPNKVLSAAYVMDNIEALMEAQAQYLGGTLPVDRYAYLIYLLDKPSLSGAMGALEHSYSSLYSLPEMAPERLSQTIKDVAAHEFFHIVTPLNIHSEEIHDFNYISPEMSQHLWLYEGVTEYSAQHVQVKYGLYGLDAFLEDIKSKMAQQQQYDVSVPYTQFSEGILEPENEKKYGDVYAGGALIAMCLDLTIIKYTDGQKNLQSLLQELSREYGPMKAFKDENLFAEIEKRTTPEVGAFLKNHVGDTLPLPFKEALGWAGINYTDENIAKVITAGKFTPALNEAQEIYVASTDQLNEFGEDLGFEEGDVLVKWNGDSISLASFQQVIQTFYSETQEGDKVEVLVKREVKGKSKMKKLKAKVMLVDSPQKFDISVEENPTDSQKRIREAWLTAK